MLFRSDWGNEGHFQYLPVSWPGFVTAAALSWNPDAPVDAVAVIAHHLTGDGSLAEATVRLGRVDELIRPGVPEAGTLASMLASPSVAPALAAGGMTNEMLEAADAELAGIAELAGASASAAPDASVWAEELRATAGWMRLSVAMARARLGWPGAPDADDLAAEHARLVATHERLWLQRNRRGGLDDSLRRLGAAVPPGATEGNDGLDHD